MQYYNFFIIRNNKEKNTSSHRTIFKPPGEFARRKGMEFSKFMPWIEKCLKSHFHFLFGPQGWLQQSQVNGVRWRRSCADVVVATHSAKKSKVRSTNLIQRFSVPSFFVFSIYFYFNLCIYIFLKGCLSEILLPRIIIYFLPFIFRVFF